MQWAKIQVITTNEAIEAVSEILTKFGAKGVEINDPLDHYEKPSSDTVIDQRTLTEGEVSVTTWIAESEKLNPEAIKKEVEGLSEFGLDPGEVKIYLSFEDDQNWNLTWREHYSPIPVASNMVIIPVWQKEEYQNDPRIKIFIDPGMAFGTGDHPTTILTLQALLIAYRLEDKVFDIGSGSGILSIAAVKLGAKNVYATDLDQTTIENAEENLRINGVSQDVELKVSDLLKATDQKADLILANILAEVHFQLIPELDSHLNEGGRVILGGIIKEKEAAITDKLEDFGFKVTERLSMKDWVSLIVQRVD
ncbi:50S ribosomal protein L11 methyltransferase [Xylocopilactobacillus apicola]|uniref:Ribosomal protein L11 methyltransferase n=1 Tax=Xylocopilactobacillus apicola TaxID=2932184 RepID=A0AAU9CVU4_9LACO|nr:50S ribosomal protein L11 methyltransferase [Xylocopilactobacillus apicola]BDR58117.1 ribosomal protein L11 methyltransferase [Xylocopilactobacillus apicola]